MTARSRTRLALLVLAAIAFAVVVGCRRGQPNAPDARAGNEFTAYTPPGVEEIELAFPGEPTWTDEPIWDEKNNRPSGSTLRLYQYKSPDQGEVFALHKDRWSWDRLDTHTYGAIDLAANPVSDLNKLVRGGVLFCPEPAQLGGMPAAEIVVPVPSRDKTVVIRGIAIQNQVYILIVRGPGKLTADSPRVKAFFDSFRWKAKPPAPAPAPGDELRPLAQIDPYVVATFDPKEPAAYILRVDPNYKKTGAGGALTRYHYPSFRREWRYTLADPGRGTPAFARIGRAMVVDAPTRQLFVIDGTTVDYERGTANAEFGLGHAPHYLVAYDLPAPPPTPPGDQDETPVLPVKADLKNLGWVWRIAAPPGGGQLFVLVQRYEQSTFHLIRFDTRTLRATAEIQVPIAGMGEHVAVSPSGKIIALTSGRAVTLVDAEQWKITRTIVSPRGTHGLAVTDNGLLIITSGYEPAPTYEPHRLLVMDITRDPAVEYRLDKVHQSYPPALSPDGQRVYLSGTKVIHSLDVGELETNKQVRTLGRVTRPEWGGRIDLSPDGKCAMVRDGRVYWLTGAGPLPEVDPGAK